MRRNLAVLAALSLSLQVSAEPPDLPALPDGGSLVTSLGSGPGDGGGPWITLDTGQTSDWTARIQCRTFAGSPGAHYLFSADAGIAQTTHFVVKPDAPLEVAVLQGSADKYRWLSLRGEDGGAPACNVFRNRKPLK